MDLRVTRDKLIYILTFIVGFFGLIFYSEPIIMFVIIGLECSLLMICLFSGKNEVFLCLLIVFIVMSQEFAYFLEADVSKVNLYSFKETRIFGLNMGWIFTGLFFVKILIVDNALSRVVKNRESMIFVKWLLFLTISATIMGVVNIILNNNEIAKLPSVWLLFSKELSYGIFVTCFAFLTIFVIDNYGYKLLSKTLIGIMICNMVVPLFASFIGIIGYYGGKQLYLTLSAYMICTFILILPCYSEYKSKLIPFNLLFIMGVLYPLLFKSIAFGKLLMIIVSAILLFLFLKSKKSGMWMIITTMIIIGLVIAWNVIIETLIKNNSLFGYKYKQILSLISVWNLDWYENMLPSPKIRITELINICIELIQNPIYFIFGKGTLGTIKDYVGQIELYNLSIYSYNEFLIKSYYGMHESLNIFLLSNGIFGVTFILKYIKKIIVNLRENPWIIIGGVWLVFLWGYSNTRTVFGVTCMCLGLSMLQKKNLRIEVIK